MPYYVEIIFEEFTVAIEGLKFISKGKIVKEWSIWTIF